MLQAFMPLDLGSESLLVSNIPVDIPLADVYTLFSHAGEIADFRVARAAVTVRNYSGITRQRRGIHGEILRS